MAQLVHAFDFTGRIGKLSFYRRKMTDKIVIRERRGVPAQRIKDDPKYINTRLNNNEFKGRNTICKAIYGGLASLKPVFDYNVYNELMSVAGKMQRSDDINDLGKRSLYFNRFGQWMEGLSFNRKTSWEAVIKVPFELIVNKSDHSATIRIPELIPGVHFQNPTAYSYYQFRFALVPVPDFVWNGTEYAASISEYQHKAVETGWHRASSVFPESEITLQAKATGDSMYSLLLASAVCFARIDEPVQYVGAGRIERIIS
jgi:hypothetical protein